MIDDSPESRAQSLATINAIADTVYRYRDPNALVEKAVDVIIQYIPVTSVALLLLAPGGESLDLVAWRGFTSETLQVGSRLPIHGSLTGLTVTHCEIITDYDIAHSEALEPRVQRALLAQGLTGCISVPLLFQEHAIGAANLIFHESQRLTRLQRETLMAIGKTIGLAVANAQHVARIEAEIQERRRVEAELVSYREHLEELVAARTADLEDANGLLREMNVRLEAAQRHAEEISQAKTVFLSNMSHEMRTPLSVIIGYASSMLKQSPIYGDVSLPDLYRNDIALILDNGQYILRLINDLLDLSKIEAGRLEMHPVEVDLAALLNEAIHDSMALLHDKPIALRTAFPESLPLAWADPVRMRQIALNLISNAIKFTRSGTITASAEVTENRVRVSVADTGIGIAESALPHIFERFRGTPSDRRYDGTGLGLNITRQLVGMQGGELMVTSTLGQGSTFSFTLKIAPNQTATPLHQNGHIRIFEVPATPAPPGTILILAPDLVLRTAIESAGYIVLCPEDQIQADAMIARFTPDLVLVDTSFLAQDGQVWIKTLPCKVGLIADKFQAVNVDLFFIKPVDPNQVVAALQQTLAESRP
jgi:signal transduction histidine kinase